MMEQSFRTRKESYDTVFRYTEAPDRYRPYAFLHQLSKESEIDLGTVNESIIRQVTDCNIIDQTLMDYADHVRSFSDEFKQATDYLMQQYAEEIERFEDYNMLLHSYNSDSIIPVSQTLFGLTDSLITAKRKEIVECDYELIDVFGNGIEQINQFIVSSAEALPAKNDRVFMLDNNLLTVYEYSRLLTDRIDKHNPYVVHNDNGKAECTLYLRGENINKIVFSTDNQSLLVTSILVSSDDVTYTPVSFPNQEIKAKENRLFMENYIPGSCTLYIPPSNYIKVTLSSADVVTGEQYSFDGGSTVFQDIYRSVIKLNGVSCYRESYERTFTATTKNLLQSTHKPLRTVSLFLHEYVPSYLSKSSSTLMEYFLTVNGKEFAIDPINSYGKKKIIRYGKQKEEKEDTYYVNEPIQNLSLRIIVRSVGSDASPCVSNIKILGQEQEG